MAPKDDSVMADLYYPSRAPVVCWYIILPCLSVAQAAPMKG